MTIKINYLTLLNFKGISNLTIPFDEVTNVSGDNGTGKTTIFDAFCWLLWGKDSTDRKDFNIKTLDENNQAIPKIPHEVSGELEIDGKVITLKRGFNEKWVRRRGDETPEFAGHETLYFINDVPVQQAEYKRKIDDIVKEELFKLITSALYFNNLKWQDRRAILTTLAGEISDDEIAKASPEFQKLLVTISGKPFEDFKKEIAGKKKKIKDELETIPARIDEVQRSLPEPENYPAIQKEIDGKKATIQEIEGAITDKSKAHQESLNKIQGKQKEIHDHKSKLQDIEFEIEQAVQKANNEKSFASKDIQQKITGTQSAIDRITRMIQINKNNITDIEKDIAGLRTKFTTEQAKELKFDPLDEICPLCKRKFDNVEDKQSEMQKHFDEEKAKTLAKINSDGKVKKEELTERQGTLKSNETELEGLETELSDLQTKLQEAQPKDLAPSPQQAIQNQLKNHKEYNHSKTQISRLELELLEVPKLDVSALNQQKAEINLELDTLKAKLSIKDVIEKAKARITQLSTDEKKLAQELATLEGLEFTMAEFERVKINVIESRINGKFKLVTFKMFNVLINGGIEPTCDTLLNGVPFPDVNSAGKIQAGLDIINTLCQFNNVYAPVFIDNRETTNEIPQMESQIINLFVTHDKYLIIN